MGPTGGGRASRSLRGLVFLTCAAKGQRNCEFISPSNLKSLLLRSGSVICIPNVGRGGIPLRIRCEHWIILEGRQVDRSTALPATYQSGTKEVASLLRGKVLEDDRILLEEVVKLRHLLEQVTEDKEAAIDRPRSSCGLVWVSCVSSDDNSWINGHRSGVRIFVKPINGRVRNSIEEPKVLVSRLNSRSYVSPEAGDLEDRRLDSANAEDALDFKFLLVKRFVTFSGNEDDSV